MADFSLRAVLFRAGGSVSTANDGGAASSRCSNDSIEDTLDTKCTTYVHPELVGCRHQQNFFVLPTSMHGDS